MKNILEIIATVIVIGFALGACAYTCTGPPTFNTITITNCVTPGAEE